MNLNSRILLKIDRAFLPVHRSIEALFNQLAKNPTSNSDHIVVIKLMGMGSIVRFASLCEQNNVDKEKITLLTFDHHKDICNLFGFGNAIFIRTTGFWRFLGDCLASITIVKARHPSFIIDYERCSHATATFRLLLAWTARCKTISFEPERTVESEKLVVYPASKITLEQLFLTGIDLMPKKIVNRKLNSVAIQLKRIFVNINASNFLTARRYPLEHFVTLIKTLNRLDNTLEFFFTGSASESDYIQELISALNGVSVNNKAGQWKISQLIDELSRCALFITGDSGPLHIAAYLRVPTIALWGPTQAYHFGYADTKHINSLSLHLSCSPCFIHPASKPAVQCNGRIDCLADLSPLRVANKAIELLRQPDGFRQVNFPERWNLTTATKPELHLANQP